MGGRRRITAALVGGNLVVLGALGLTAHDVVGTSRLVDDATVEACLQLAGVGPTWDLVVDDLQVGPGASFTATFRRPEAALVPSLSGGTVRCEVERPLSPWGAVRVRSAEAVG